MSEDRAERWGRAIVYLSEEDVLRAVGEAGQGYRVVAVFPSFERQAIGVVVEHPDLQQADEAAQLPTINAQWGREMIVQDGKVWERSRLTVEQAIELGVSS